ncbi:uncharacterized protein [Clytia hemisphaerica]|uniref:Uncharacterized protein n=1 Tax=Clytia hemisphaerica TaxID=252671 RepID=A0A7M5WQ87_9CNID|eukprot:TCONS_00046080-protein
MEKLTWFLVVGFGCLSVLNFVQYQEINSRFVELQQNSQGEKTRTRRDVANDEKEEWSSFFDQQKLINFIQKQSNQTIYKEVNQILKHFTSNFPAEKLCKDLFKCEKEKCEDERRTVVTEDKTGNGKSRCLQGPPGPPGPPGPAGPGLEEPKLVSSTLSHGQVNITKTKVFECKFYGNPIPDIEWKVPAKSFEVDSTVDKKRFEITSHLTIHNVTWGEQGRVECSAKSLLGEAYESGNLTVLTKPQILSRETLVFAPEGITFDFPKCDVQANPPAKITWKRIFWPLPAGRFTVQGDNLKISNIQFKDEGFYVCEAENFLGKTKANIQLKVKAMEIEKSSPAFLKQEGGQVAEIHCSAYGNSQRMSGKITRVGSSELIQEETTRTPNLISVKASVRGEGTYRCTIRNNKSGKQVEAVTRVEKECGSGWTEYSGDCYAYINQKKTWYNAELYCISKGGHLASIKSKQENDFVYGLTPGGRNNYWIGLSDKQVEGSFTRWSDGKTATYTNFENGQPNNSGNQDCVSFFEDAAEKWNDWGCSKSFTFVCKISQ